MCMHLVNIMGGAKWFASWPEGVGQDNSASNNVGQARSLDLGLY